MKIRASFFSAKLEKLAVVLKIILRIMERSKRKEGPLWQ